MGPLLSLRLHHIARVSGNEIIAHHCAEGNRGFSGEAWGRLTSYCSAICPSLLTLLGLSASTFGLYSLLSHKDIGYFKLHTINSRFSQNHTELAIVFFYAMKKHQLLKKLPNCQESIFFLENIGRGVSLPSMLLRVLCL